MLNQLATRILNRRLSRFVKKLVSVSTNREQQAAPHGAQRWSIGMYAGESPFHLKPLHHVNNPVLSEKDVSDVNAAFVADPFMVRANNYWHMFFEVLNRHTGKGEIGLATSETGESWTYQKIILSEDFHLSYPYVFEWRGQFYMLPETYQTNSVRLYRATTFPFQWSLEKTLLDGREYVDPSIFSHNDQWWLFTCEGAPPYRSDTLRLYYTDELIGTWIEHPQSPIIEGNAQIARPAGRITQVNGKKVRYTQDCHGAYGSEVRAFEITELTTTKYQEREIFDRPILAPSGTGWNECGMHHLDAHQVDDAQWLACVDGWTAAKA